LLANHLVSLKMRKNIAAFRESYFEIPVVTSQTHSLFQGEESFGNEAFVAGGAALDAEVTDAERERREGGWGEGGGFHAGVSVGSS